tara:strand:+ start:5526 stop:6230 length:705 start_codon:yes stop_codon:yes gene_type:complete
MLTKNQIKFIRSLTTKKNRIKNSLFVVEGEKIVNEIIKSDWQIHSIYASSDWEGKNATIISKSDLCRISNQKSPNKVLALVRIKENFSSISSDTILALDSVKDPGNLGTIIRVADWFGVKNILCSEDCVDYFNPKVIQSSMGSFLRVGIKYANLLNTFKLYPNHEILATVLNGTPINNITTKNKKIIVLGSESNGIKREILEKANQKITISKSEFSKAESLNVSIASAIVLSKL